MLKTENEQVASDTLETRPKRTVILINGKAGCGKDTLAKILYRGLKDAMTTECKMGIVSNAKAVKTLAFNEFTWNRLKDDRGRQLLIDITNAGYKYDSSFWEKKTIQEILNNNYLITLIPDWRYENTYHFFKQCGFNVIAVHLERTKLQSTLSDDLKADKSEQGFDKNLYDFNVVNSSDDLDHLEQLVNDLLIPTLLKRMKL